MKLTDGERGVLTYIRHYPEWVAEVETLADMRNAITYDADKVQTSPRDDVVMDVALKIEAAQEKIDKVESALVTVYRTDERVNMMRMVFCYQGKSTMRKREFYTLRKIFAGVLLEVFHENQ